MESEISNKQEENPTNKDRKGNRDTKPASEHTTEASSASAERLMRRAARPEHRPCLLAALDMREPAPELRDRACGRTTGVLSVRSFVGRTVATGARSGRQALIVSRAGGREPLPEGLGTGWSAL